MAEKLPGKGLLGWLGRQVGYVSKAVRTEPAALPRPAGPAPKPSAKQTTPPSTPPTDAQVLYREGRVEEADHPTRPDVKLRRTVIDEVIVKEPPADPTGKPPPKARP